MNAKINENIATAHGIEKEGLSKSEGQSSIDSPCLRPDALLLNVSRQAEAATAALKSAPPQGTFSTEGKLKRRLSKRIHPHEISLPHLISSSSSIKTLPIGHPNLSPQLLSPMVETHTASKLNQGLKKLQITLGTRSSPQDNEATSVSQHASYSTSFISTSSAGRAPSLARWPWHTRDHPHLNHATDVEGNNNLTGSSQPAPSRSNIKGLKIRIGKHVKKGWNDPMSPRETSKHASLPYPQNYGSLQVDGQPSTPPTESGIALLPHLDFLSSHSPTSASSFMSVASEPAVGRTSVASYLPQVKPTTGRLLIPEEWRRLPSSPELHIVGTSLHESPVAQTSLVGPGNSFLRADQNSSMPNRPPPIPHGSRRNSHASSVQSTINEVTAFPERSRPHSIYTHVSKPSDTSSFYGTYFQDESQWSTQDASANEAFTVVSGTGSGNASFSSAALEPGECGKSQVVRLPSSPDGEEVWSALDFLRERSDEESESLFRRSMISSYSDDTSDNLEVRFKDRGWESNDPEEKQEQGLSSGLRRRQTHAGPSCARPQTKLFTARQSTIGNLFEDLAKDTDFGSFKFVLPAASVAAAGA